METRVRYIAVGFFALVTGFATLVFLLWLQNAGTLRGRRDLLLHFDGPATGLRAGAPVTFNGIRIGEVTRLTFDPADPRAVLARLSIEAGAPISRDTQADVDTQGIVGTVQVALQGGSPQERLVWRDGQPPVLDARPALSLTQEARAALTNLRALMSDNAEPLHNVIANIDTFATALARNSGRVDSILAGLERMTGGDKPAAPRMFDLAVPDLAKWPEGGETVQLAVGDPSGLVMYDTQKLLLASSGGEISPGAVQWSDTIPKLVQRKVLQGLEQAGLRYGSSGAEAATAEVQLQLEIRAFELARTPERHAQITLAARLAGADGKVLDAATFSAQAPAAEDDGPKAAAAMNEAFADVLRALVAWCGEVLAKR